MRRVGLRPEYVSRYPLAELADTKELRPNHHVAWHRAEELALVGVP